MTNLSPISRRDFTATTILTLLNGVVITVAGCGDSAPTPFSPAPATTTTPPPATGSGNNVTGVVSANHGHVAVVTSAMLSAGSDVIITIDGNADHPHSVSLTAADLTQIAAGTRVVKTSSTLLVDPLYPEVPEHSHSVTFN